jgi:hypothetical protein
MSNKISRKKFRIITSFVLLALVIGIVSNVAAAVFNEPTYGSVVVDGVYSEWDLVNDYFAPMYEAGVKDKINFSDLYLRYECPTSSNPDGILYALVLTQSPYEILDDNNSNWIKEYSLQSSPLVDGGSGNDGTPPDFEYIEENGVLVGWEASVSLALGNYTQFEIHAQVVSEDPGGATSSTGKNDPISVDLLCPAAIDIEKHTNGEDADAAPGPWIPTGMPVTWTYYVTNTSPHDLYGVVVTDDKLPAGEITCDWDTFGEGNLPAFASITCTATGIAVEGQYENLATVIGNTCMDLVCGEVTDEDPSHYFGIMDFGDLPDSFGMTTLANNGARHSLTEINLTIGLDKDMESDGNPDAAALGDDLDNVADENGVYRPTGSNWSDGQGELIVIVDVDVPTQGNYVGCLTGWLDFHDGAGGGPDFSFDDDGEYIIQNIAVVVGENQLSFPLPVGVADDASLFGRFRLVPITGEVIDGVCTQSPVEFSGYAEGGEVEDQVFVFGPTAIALAGFTANASRETAQLLKWVYSLVLIGLVSVTITALFMRKQWVSANIK